MNLKPRQLSTWEKRLQARREAVTICAAAINIDRDNKPIIHLVFDKQVTFGNGAFGADGTMWKLKRINAKWCVMFAGEVSSLPILREAVIDAVQYETKANFRKFSRLCAKAFRDERKEIIKTQILPDYDLESYEEYLRLKKDHRPLFDAISEKIRELENEWSLLFAGFDELDEPHIFVITENGKIQYCDSTGFACVGSGGWPAYASLAAHPYNINLYPGEAIFALLAAKFCAEPSHGVGDTTAFLNFRPTDKLRQGTSGISQSRIEELRDKWKALPKVPEGVVDKLTEECRAYDKAPKMTIPFRKRHRKEKSKR